VIGGMGRAAVAFEDKIDLSILGIKQKRLSHESLFCA
jgi:hypothetical protein